MTDTSYRQPEQTSAARQRQRSRYDRPRRTIIWTALLFGMIVGMVAGLSYAWVLAPIAETDVAPWQLADSDETDDLLADQDAYLIALMMEYSYQRDLAVTVQKLVDLRLPGNDPIQYVADSACRLVREGFVNSNNRRNAIRNMMTFYQSQGKTGCADNLIMNEGPRATSEPAVIILPTSTLLPPATKTPPPGETLPPSPTPDTSGAIKTVPTAPPRADFEVAFIEPFCREEIPGVIEVRVRDRRTGDELPGLPLRVRSADEESTFFTGLKPERGLGYADYEMTEGQSYIIEMPGLSDPSTTLTASPCNDEITGDPAIRSYRVVFVGS
jgi:hypothetical protein